MVNYTLEFYWYISCMFFNKVKNAAVYMIKFKFLMFSVLLISNTVNAADIQPVPSIEEAINAQIKLSLGTSAKYEINITPLDRQLKLPLCDQELQVYPQSGEVKPGHNTIAVKCSGSNNWLIYTQVYLRSFKNVIVLNKALHRNDVIKPEYLQSENREVSTLIQGYIEDSAELVNKQAARNLAAGAVLNSQSYQELTLVKRGDKVNIQLGNQGISISAAGTAMSNGIRGERINVKNLSSQKVIQAVVMNAGQVAVNF